MIEGSAAECDDSNVTKRPLGDSESLTCQAQKVIAEGGGDSSRGQLWSSEVKRSNYRKRDS